MIKWKRYEQPRIYDENDDEIIGAKDVWIALVTSISENIESLLRFPFHKFWSSVVFNSSIADCLVSCLQETPAFYDLDKFPNDLEMRELLERLRRGVLIVFTRLVTSKESKIEFISHETHGKLLYDHYLLTVPMMFDLCQLYGRENYRIVERIIHLAIQLQPMYNDDLKETFDFLTKVRCIFIYIFCSLTEAAMFS